MLPEGDIYVKLSPGNPILPFMSKMLQQGGDKRKRPQHTSYVHANSPACKTI